MEEVVKTDLRPWEVLEIIRRAEETARRENDRDLAEACKRLNAAIWDGDWYKTEGGLAHDEWDVTYCPWRRGRVHKSICKQCDTTTCGEPCENAGQDELLLRIVAKGGPIQRNLRAYCRMIEAVRDRLPLPLVSVEPLGNKCVLATFTKEVESPTRGKTDEPIEVRLNAGELEPHTIAELIADRLCELWLERRTKRPKTE